MNTRLTIETESKSATDESSKAWVNERIPILYIEDDAAMHHMFRLLENTKLYPFQFTFFSTLASGLEELKHHANKYKAVLSDYHLPDGDAKSLFPLHADLPVVVLTATYDVNLAVELVKSGVDDFLVKDAGMKFIQMLPDKISSVIEKKESEMEAERQKRRFRDLYDNVNDIILYLDDTGNIIQANPMLLEILGYPVSTNSPLYLIIHTNDRDEFEALLTSLPPDEKIDDYLIRILGHEGKEFIMEASVSKSRFHKDYAYTRVILRDVTERKTQEKLIRTQNADLERKNHEINEGLLKLRNMSVSRRSALIVFVLALVLFLLSEFWLEPIIIQYSGNTNYVWINKVVIVLLLKPIDMFIERWLLRQKIKEAGLSD